MQRRSTVDEGRMRDHRPRAALVVILLLGTALAGAAGAVTKPPEPETVVLTASDSVQIAGFWFDCYEDNAPAVLLLHDHGRDHYGWGTLWPVLQRFGYHVLAIDLRGHGASRELSPEEYEALVRREASVYREMVLDAEAGVRFLQREKKVPLERIAVIGGELGCAVGFALMAQEPRLRGMAALGPGSIEYGFQTLQLVQKYGPRPLLIVSSKQELGRGPQAIVEALRGEAPVKLEIFVGANVRGTAMLGQPVEVERIIYDWLRQILPPGR